MTTNGIRVPVAKWLPTPLLSDGFGSAFGTSDGLGHAEGVAGGIGAGGSGVTLSNAGGTWSVSGGKAINTPSVGAELLTNSDFSAWTGDDPDGWTVVGTEDAGSYVTESSGKARIVSDGDLIGLTQSALTANHWYKTTLSITAVAAGAVALNPSALMVVSFRSSTGTQILTTVATAASFIINRSGGVTDVTVDDASAKELTFNELVSLSDISTADVMAGVSLVNGSGYLCGLALNWDSASSPANGVICALVLADGVSSRVALLKCVAGVWSLVSLTIVTYSAGARLVVQKSGTEYRVYYNDALVTAQTISDAGIVNNTLHGLFSTDASNVLNDLTIYATGTGGEYSQLDSY